MQEEDVDAAVKMINKIISRASVGKQRRKRKHQPWFDKHCKEAKKKWLFLRDTCPGSKIAKEAHKSYRTALKEKRKTHFEEKQMNLILTAAEKPWLLKPWKTAPSLPWQVSVQHVKQHFSTLFSKNEEDSEEKETEEEVDHESFSGTPFAEEEVMDAFLSLPNKKAPGLDNLTGEQLEGSLLSLLHTWTTLFNLSAEEATTLILERESSYSPLQRKGRERRP